MIRPIAKLLDMATAAVGDVMRPWRPHQELRILAEQKRRWRDLRERAGQAGSVLDLLRELSLGITPRATGLAGDIDIARAIFPDVLRVLQPLARARNEDVLVLGGDRIWRRLADGPGQPGKSGCVEIAVVDAEGRLTERCSVHLWRSGKDYAVAVSENAPVKRASADGHFPAGLAPVDFTVPPPDIVYTWVNAADPGWRALVSPYKDIGALDPDRFEQTDELRYSLRSVALFAPWAPRVHIFSNCAPPDWFRETDRYRWVRHEDVVPESYRPLFNSHAIETFLHEIPGLSDRFVYFNDDFFLCAPLRPTDFFTAYGRSVARLEPYGTLHHLATLKEEGKAEEWQSAAVNSARLAQAKNGVFPTRLHRHAPYAIDKTVYERMIRDFPAEAETTRSARFRAPQDISFTSFLYHHLALGSGDAVEVAEESPILRPTNFRQFLRGRKYRSVRFFCLNDGGNSATHGAYRKFKIDFLSRHYIAKAPCER